MPVAGVSTGAIVVFALIGVALVLFVSETFPSDVTALGVVVVLALLEPVIGLTPREAISGFSNPATITIVAMYMLSAGIQETGIVEWLGVKLAAFTRGEEDRALAATVCTTGPMAGFVNNTPIVAVFIPMVQDLARDADISPSKLLMPLSYAAILGGTLTLIGTSTNILASDAARELIRGREGIGIFEITPLGVVVLAVGIAYLVTIAPRLTPARVPVDADPLERFDMEDHLGRVVVREGSPLVGTSVDEVAESVAVGGEIAVLQLRRNGEVYAVPDADEALRPGDRLIVNGTLQAINRFQEANDLRHLHRESVTAATFDEAPTGYTLATAVIPEDSEFAGETARGIGLERFHQTRVLAVRRDGELYRTGLREFALEPGDHILLRTTPQTIEYFDDSPAIWIVDERVLEAHANGDDGPTLSSHTPVALSILVVVVLGAAVTPAPIVVAALGGAFGMMVTDCISPADAYDAVSWNVVFLLAGVIPLGLAMERTGGATVLADLLVASAGVLPLLAVLYCFYLVTSLLSNAITPVATIVLMLPVAVDTAAQLGANQFAFLLAVTFAAATPFLTPIGYQTNLMVYGPGGFEFTDFVRVGAPLQLLLSVVTTAGIWAFWGL
ncbi:Citrate transporter [Salinarchaeum sp. Harcht-Bsk1]|uniref:SLC13 family permease n=1 Tax=Salinarchaeum sp. Harcht-Bsk1 TaxID=1333523 RepID=UPI00034245F1|nr:SLC13 family permease [Salinarchaeum sp. Harcht-Bsk1]AGN02526.1 Citrate transporter [Salinarchaeum sp. Harcht-Bsk1]